MICLMSESGNDRAMIGVDRQSQRRSFQFPNLLECCFKNGGLRLNYGGNNYASGNDEANR